MEVEDNTESFGGGMHQFTISVHLQGSGCDWGSDMKPQVVDAFSLVEALEKARQIPLADWFTDEEKTRAQT